MRPILILNPRSDAQFVALVSELMADAARTNHRTCRRACAPEFPDAVVRRRELSSEPTEVWYVYRDGRWTPD